MNGAYFWFVLAVGAERLLELHISRRHETGLHARGQTSIEEPLFKWMVAVHVALLPAALFEHAFAGRPFGEANLVAVALFILATALRWWAITTLGAQWTVKIVMGQDLRVRTAGPYRYIRHPNYLGVIVEVAAIPLIGGAYLTAAMFALANLWIVLKRMELEEAALTLKAEYQNEMHGRARLIPGVY